MTLIYLFIKMKHWNLDVISYWVIGPGCQIEKDLELSPVPQIVQKIPENYCRCLYLSTGQVWWVVVQKIYSKMYFISCTNTHHDVTDLVNHWMVKNTKTWISWEQNIAFLQNKQILNLCLRWNILRSYSLLAEVTFNV